MEVSTTGVDVDTDGYSLLVGNLSARAIKVNDTITIKVTEVPAYIDSLKVKLGGVAANCDPDLASKAVRWLPGGDGVASFSISCITNAPPASLVGRQLLFGRGGRMYRATIGDTGSVDIGAGSTPRWSPSGNRIAFVRDSSLYVMDADGANMRLVFAGTVGALSAAPWSPDGQRLAASSAINVGFVIVGVDAAATYSKVGTGCITASPAWSPDGQRIAFWAAPETDFSDSCWMLGLYVMDAATGISVDLLSPAVRQSLVDAWSPAWSPDGAKLALVACRYTECWSSGWPGIAVVTVDGSDPQWLLQEAPNSRHYLQRPVWSPDGKTVVYERYDCTLNPCTSTTRWVAADGSARGLLMDEAVSASFR